MAAMEDQMDAILREKMALLQQHALLKAEHASLAAGKDQQLAATEEQLGPLTSGSVCSITIYLHALIVLYI